MKCPIDDSILQMTERQAIEIDYCPQCRGVWLDRGELDKLIEKTASAAPVSEPSPSPGRSQESPRPSYQRESSPQRYDDRHGDRGPYTKKKKKESFLGELFDF